MNSQTHCCDIREVYLDALYAAYMAHPPQSRASALYEFFRLTSDQQLTMENVMQHGSRELPDFSAFIPQWIDYLGMQTGETAQQLIEEAFDCFADQTTLHANARKYCLTHPGLYRKRTGVEVGAVLNDRPVDGQSRERPSRSARRESTPVIRTISSVHKGVHL